MQFKLSPGSALREMGSAMSAALPFMLPHRTQLSSATIMVYMDWALAVVITHSGLALRGPPSAFLSMVDYTHTAWLRKCLFSQPVFLEIEPPQSTQNLWTFCHSRLPVWSLYQEICTH
jgi:hypothetical protein